MDQDKIKQIQKLLDVAEGNLHSARNLFLELTGEKSKVPLDALKEASKLAIAEDGKVIEGIFNGEEMIAPDQKKYPVPANYASKSKLVEGDTLKLTIAEDGTLVYKQIKPINRRKTVGTLSYENGNYFALAEGKNYRVLFASVSYFKGNPGDRVSIILPEGKESQWAALESVIHHGESTTPENPVNTTPEQSNIEEANEPPINNTKESRFELPDENVKALEALRRSITQPNPIGTEQKAEEVTSEEKVEVAPATPSETLTTEEVLPENNVDAEKAEAVPPTDTFGFPEVEAPVEAQPVREPFGPPIQPDELIEAEESGNIEALAEERPDSDNENAIKNGTTYDNPDSFVKAETEKNALGEELKPASQDEKAIEEMEI